MTGYNEEKSALVFDIYRGTTHDGPGMRTTLFLKGCPLSCRWCHNPEGISFQNGISYTKSKCIGCCICSLTAGKEIVRVENGRPIRIAALQEIPSASAGNCTAPAQAVVAREYTVNELFAEAARDRSFFESFGGGVTISGGEPASRPGFILPLLRKLKEDGIHTALDTCGYVQWPVLRSLLAYTDLVLYDIKVADSQRHLALTGVENRLILENLANIVDYKKHSRNDLSIWVRTPLIPKDTATTENIAAIGKLLNSYGDGQIEQWELCAFNNTCTGKYERLGLVWDYRDAPLLTDREAAEIVTVAAPSLGKDKTKLSGFTRR